MPSYRIISWYALNSIISKTDSLIKFYVNTICITIFIKLQLMWYSFTNNVYLVSLHLTILIFIKRYNRLYSSFNLSFLYFSIFVYIYNTRHFSVFSMGFIFKWTGERQEEADVIMLSTIGTNSGKYPSSCLTLNRLEDSSAIHIL